MSHPIDLIAITILLLVPSIIFIAIPKYDDRKLVLFFLILVTCFLMWYFTKKVGKLATICYTIVGALFLIQQLLFSF